MNTPTFQYHSPVVAQIGKSERFDEDNMKPLLCDDDFAKGDRVRLSNYKKKRLSGGRVSVSYKLGRGCEEHKLGRLFPVDGIGLQAFRSDFRNPLAAKYYWDTDFENCHYHIALHHAKKLSLQHKHMEHYVMNREDILRLVSASRIKAKTEMLKTLYLGNMKLYCESYEEVEGGITPEGHQFIGELSKEVETLALVLWEKHPELHHVKTGADNKAFSKKPNPRASLMSMLFQTDEREMLMVWDAFLAHEGRYLAVYIHDGGYVEKLEKETAFPPELLLEGAREVEKCTGISCVLTQKEIRYEWTPKRPQEDQYLRMKEEFEQHTFLVGTQLYHIMKDGTPTVMTVRDGGIKFAPLNVDVWNEQRAEMETKSFLDKWIKDPKRRAYDRVDFFPNVEKCPPSVYNLFKGFRAEKYEPAEPMSPECIAELVRPIIVHVDYLTKGNSGYFLKVFANIIQHPDRKAQVAMLIRDMGNLLHEGGGTGKNLLIEFYGHEIIGEDYCIVIGDNKELYNNFNSQFEGKLLVFVEEACSKDNHSNNDTLKSRITSRRSNINKKMVAQYTVNDFANYIFTSNNINPLPIRQGDRRFAVFDTDPVKRGDVAYFSSLVAHLERPKVKWAFFQYLKTLDTYSSPAEFSANVPITEAYRDLRVKNAPIHMKWLVHKVTEFDLRDGFIEGLYQDFSGWVAKYREKAMDSIMSLPEFGSKLSSDKSANEYVVPDQGEKVKRRGLMYMKWDVGAVVEGLKKLHLLDPDFVYEGERKEVTRYVLTTGK